MWSEQTSPMFLVVVALSIAAHVAVLAILPADAASPEPHVSSVVQFETVAPPPPAPKREAPAATEETAPRPSPSPSPAPARRVARRPVAPPRQVAQPTAEPPAGADAPVDFSGVTLSNEGASWSTPTGDGSPMTGPIAAGQPGAAPGPMRRGPSGTSTERVVAVGDLSRPPKAPDLDSALAANYPSDARRAGTTGKAVVRARILADGSVGTIRVLSESAAGFGAACKRTLTGSRWQAPLDAQHAPVITDVSYTCTFAVAR